MKISYTFLFLYLASICFAQEKGALFYKEQFHTEYENKTLSNADSVEAVNCLYQYILLSLEQEEKETAQEYADILYAYTERSDILHSKIRAYEVRIELADETVSEEIIRFYHKKIISYADSILSQHPKDSTAIKSQTTYTRYLGINYSDSYLYDSSMFFLKQSLQYTKQYQLLGEQATNYNSLGIVSLYTGAYEVALDYYNKAIQLAETMQDSINIMTYLVNSGGPLYHLSRHEESTKRCLKALDYAIMLGKQETQTDIYINISYNYSDLKDYETALSYLELAKAKFLEIDDKIGLLYYYDNVSIIYKEQGKYDEALAATEKLLNLAKELKDNSFLTLGTEGKGIIFYEQKKYKLAKQHLQTAIQLATDNDFIVILLDAQLNLGKVYLAEKAYESAIKELEKVKQQEANLDITQQQFLNEALAKSYAGLQQFDKAYPLYVAYKNLQDSTLNEEKIRAVTRLEANYTHQQEIERQELLHQADSERQNFVRKSLLAGLGLVGVLAFVIFVNYRNKANANHLLEQKNAAIRKQKEQLEQLNHTKDRLFAIIGHDLRKPAISFRGISKKVNYLIKKQDFDTLRQFGDQIEENAFALNKLTNNLLNWALTQRHVMPHKPMEIAVDEYVEEAVSIFATAIREKELQISKQIRTDTKVYADPNTLRIILINLLDNAIKYTPEGGTIHITALEEDEQLFKIRVSDTGIGMTTDQLNDLFLLKKEKSQRGTAGEKGTGLGMHLVKELVELNKGIISAASELGKGTSFDLVLPIRAYS